MEKLRATHGTACYSGGGFYIVLGETENGLYFVGGNDCDGYCELYDTDPRTKTSELLNDYSEWCDIHRVDSYSEDEVQKMFRDFCRRLDKCEMNISRGYEAYENYMPGDMTLVGLC